MADIASDAPIFDRTKEVVAGELAQISPLVQRLVAPNPGPFTFTGTCTYLVGTDHVAVIDPGPENPAHLAALLDALKGRTLSHILVTHTHRDHSPGARALRAATGAPILGCAPYKSNRDAHGVELDSSHDLDYAPDCVLKDGQRLMGKGYTLTALATPGHASNHLCFAFAEDQALFSGDHVMAWSTTVVAPPDGEMRAYLASLERLRGRVETVFWPGHGGPVMDPQRQVRALLQHRRQREAAILLRIESGDHSIEAMVERIYEGLNPMLKRGAALSVLAHLEDMVERGVVKTDGGAMLSALYRRA